MSDAIRIVVQEADFDTGQELTALRVAHPGAGAVVAFVGAVRDISGGAAVDMLELEHYPGMTERALADIVAQAARRWPFQGVTVIHRYGGPLRPTDQIVLVAVASAHRGEAFSACEFIMDYLKTEAPFWKKEGTGGARRWVDARETDDHARSRWGGGG
ncbi:molybdopterin synthase catalytic subunit MoaE [Robbsia andropogonis]|uniref:molybdopterin synthase catalytic subunit MoaE n=1 Tax=Robbsia andropogonis TaxID=28092 RepID=UPI0004B447F7|nr:molybdopterin synthase catalytic subunit MoaE [Robbsia andropogonis]